jgi:hypothetical protein
LPDLMSVLKPKIIGLNPPPGFIPDFISPHRWLDTALQ